MSDEPTIVADATSLPALGEEALPERRGPGRPKGSKNRDRVATIERINKEADPLGFRIRALNRGWVLAAPSETAKHRERVYLTKDERLRLAQQLEDKVLPRLRSFEVSGVGDVTNNLQFNSISLGSTEGAQRAASLLRRALLRHPELTQAMTPEVSADAVE